jgi:hypothetical protein
VHQERSPRLGAVRWHGRPGLTGGQGGGGGGSPKSCVDGEGLAEAAARRHSEAAGEFCWPTAMS